MLPVNPPAERLGQENAVLSGKGTRYYVPNFEGCLSLKSVVNGTAVWETEKRRFVLREDCWLILNDRQRYTITIDSHFPVKTFCLFFERGFVEDVNRASATACDALLDSPQPYRTAPLQFFTRVEPGDNSLMSLLKRFQTGLSAQQISGIEWEGSFLWTCPQK